MLITGVRVQVPPRAPNKKDTRLGVFFIWCAPVARLLKCERVIPSPLALSPCKAETCRFCMTFYPSKVILSDVLFFCVRGGLDLRPIFTGAPRKSASFCGERTNSGASESCRLRRDEGCVACEDAVPPRAPLALHQLRPWRDLNPHAYQKTHHTREFFSFIFPCSSTRPYFPRIRWKVSRRGSAATKRNSAVVAAWTQSIGRPVR